VNNPIDYYFDMSPKIKYEGKSDQRGVFLYKMNAHSGWCYYPITIFIYGIAAYQRFLHTGNYSYLEIMNSQIDWAISNQIKRGKKAGGWEFNISLDIYNLKPNWISAMAQGLGISLLLRAWVLKNKHSYLDCAMKAFLPFLNKVEDGGVKTNFQDKYIFYEEFPSKPSSFVLNGYITSLLGVRDLAIFLKHKEASQLWQEGIETLKKIIKYYDLGFWSKYDLYKASVNIASPFYHRYHISQLELMYRLTGEKIFDEYSKKFETYSKNVIFKSKAVIKKALWRMKRL
jgi:hypothetical protein